MSGSDTHVRDAEAPLQTEDDSSEPPSAVHVRFVPAAGQRLKRPEPTTCPGEEPLWTERPLLIKRADATYELIGTSHNLLGLARWLLSFGPRAEVQSPSRLQEQVALQARRVWRQYDD